MSLYVDTSAFLKLLDALHLAAAQRVAAPGLAFLTFDLRQAQAARQLGLAVIGAWPAAASFARGSALPRGTRVTRRRGPGRGR